MSEVKRTNPQLWESVKKEVIRGTKGGPANKWSARKAQLSVALYKSRGGGYIGKKSPKNSLTKWSREQWGYVKGSRSKSGTKKPYGRYLPKVVREHLSPTSARAENRKKGSRAGKWVPYGKEVRTLMRKYGVVKSTRSRRR